MYSVLKVVLAKAINTDTHISTSAKTPRHTGNVTLNWLPISNIFYNAISTVKATTQITRASLKLPTLSLAHVKVHKH